jgi:hypothetical protein
MHWFKSVHRSLQTPSNQNYYAPKNLFRTSQNLEPLYTLLLRTSPSTLQIPLIPNGSTPYRILYLLLLNNLVLVHKGSHSVHVLHVHPL